jgi:type I restriction enzyme M protein
MDAAKQEAKAAGKEAKRIGTDRNIKQLKLALEQLHKEVKSAESYFKHIHWLQERFPKAEYEDVTGLCKLATPEEVAEQDYSLNPGRYVGVVIEEDGKTEEEFVALLDELNSELALLNSESAELASIINKNVSALVDV